MILRPQLEHHDDQSVLDYYLDHYDEVHIITCNKCGTDLGIEIRGNVSGYQPNDLGYTVLPLGSSLLSSRVRTDGSMGYQCGAQMPNPAYPAAKEATDKVNQDLLDTYDKQYKEMVKEAKIRKTKAPEYSPPQPMAVPVPEIVACGNDTRGTQIEEELSPTGTFLPHEVAAIHQRYAEVGWKPKIRRKGNKEIHETFTRERVK